MGDKEPEPNEPNFYRGKQSPFLSKHKCAKVSYSLSATTFHRAYHQRAIINKGDLAAAVLGAKKIVGTVKEVKIKGRGRYICFDHEPEKWYACSKCVRMAAWS